MTEINSYSKMKNIQENLFSLAANFEDMYNDMVKECKTDFKTIEMERDAKVDAMHDLYDELWDNLSMRISWIKKKLPWYITKFCKISSTEMQIRGAIIYIGVNFGKSKYANCYIQITPKDIGL